MTAPKLEVPYVYKEMEKVHFRKAAGQWLDGHIICQSVKTPGHWFVMSLNGRQFSLVHLVHRDFIVSIEE